MRNVHYASDDSLEKLVVEQLIAGPAGSKLTAVVPSDTVVREIRTEGDLCTVNLSSEFNQAVAGSSVTPEVTVYAIVNSICESCEDITKVQIQVEAVQMCYCVIHWICHRCFPVTAVSYGRKTEKTIPRAAITVRFHRLALIRI